MIRLFSVPLRVLLYDLVSSFLNVIFLENNENSASRSCDIVKRVFTIANQLTCFEFPGLSGSPGSSTVDWAFVR